MSQRFRAFSFVDRITAFQSRRGATAIYHIPAPLTEFSGTLVAEAIGQLGGWAAMEATDFRFRLVAGIASRLEILGAAQPGQILELAIQVESVDEDAIAYHGEARVEGTPVLRMHDCLGPMLPAEDFDDPIALRSRFELIRGPGAVPGAFEGLPSFPLADIVGNPGEHLEAELAIPDRSPFFEDHFPRKPVFPGSLLIQCKLHLAAKLAGQLPPPTAGGSWKISGLTGMKLRAFIAPGEHLTLKAKKAGAQADDPILTIESYRGPKLVGAVKAILAAA